MHPVPAAVCAAGGHSVFEYGPTPRIRRVRPVDAKAVLSRFVVVVASYVSTAHPRRPR